MAMVLYFALFIIVIALVLSSYEIRAYLRLRKLNFMDRAAHVNNAKARVERHRDDAMAGRQWQFVAFFVALSLFCAYLGLYFSAIYAGGWGAHVLSECIKDAILVKTARYNDVENTIVEAQTA
jgi:hypothetical protein